MPAPRYIGALLAPAAVLASRHAISAPTPTVSADPVDGFSPRITGAARIEDAAIELLKRYVDYDQTCGFVNGDLESALTCAGTYICATNTVLDVAGCCDPLSLDSCYLYTSCVPSSQLASCTAADCLLDQAVAKCTDSSAPYCVDWKYDYITTTLAGYGCDVSAFTGTVEYTYSGQNTFDISSYLSSIPEFSFPTIFVTQTQVVSAGLSSGTSTSSSSSSGSGDNDDNNSKKVSIGAIVGGVVGGLGALAILGGVVICLLFKRRRDKRNAAAAAAFQPAQPPPPPQPQPQQPPMPYGAPPPGGPGPNDYKPPAAMAGVPQMQQPGNTASFYAPPPPPPPQQQQQQQGGDVKYDYTHNSVSSMPSTPGPYSPPMSPSPQYSPSPPLPVQQQQQHQQQQQQQQWNSNVPQIDGTPVHKNSEGQTVHEAP
ncbi:uncharacterized protein BKCO1_1000350 [Diplodia corticola]|uniref:Uncharacterized protein n=1 Tax=Diplodia corticola TaxID=236234 RepID=A0A1J9S6H8_9PEZI|nr:uncharacterized protein BKCO1_1000350 [Diplodia corticola]OJD40547.1 hypothetical protein BKCO1_1000350 [Diplodia corticola]